MLLALDVGNTDTVLGLFCGSILIFEDRSSTQKIKSLILKHKFMAQKCEAAMISSVVPSVDRSIRDILRKKLKIKKVLFVSHKMKLPITLKVDKPSEVGADRIANNVAAYDQCKSDVLVIDFGTATTIDYIDVHGHYRGGMIIPGIKTAANALIEKAEKLNSFPFARPKKILGQNTITQLQSGVLMSHAAMIDRMVEKIQKEIRKKPKIIATGGLSSMILPLSEHLNTLDSHLTLKGLRLLYLLNS